MKGACLLTEGSQNLLNWRVPIEEGEMGCEGCLFVDRGISKSLKLESSHRGGRDGV